MTLTQMPPRGHYLAHEVGRLAGVSGRTIGQWARRGYIRSSQSDRSPRVYSYQDVAEAMVVHALLDSNTAHEAIKATIQHLRATGALDWPLQHATLSVPQDHPAPSHRKPKPKRSIVAHDALGGIDTSTGEPVLPDIDLEAIATDLRRGGWAARNLDLRHIEVNPNRVSGRPVIAGHRVPAEDVARLAQQPKGRKILRNEYDLADEQIDDALRWWKAVQEYDADAA